MTSAVPLALTINAGVGTNTLDLAQLHVTDLHLNSGVGSTALILPGAGKLQTTVKGGVGETTVYIPTGMAARIRARSGLGQTSVPDGFQRTGDAYVTPGFETAGNRVELDVTGGIGAIRIEVKP